MSGWGALLGLVAGIGLLCVGSFVRSRRPPSVLDRISPYTAAATTRRPHRARRPVSLAEVTTQLLPLRVSQGRRVSALVRAGREDGVAVYRFERLLWTAIGGLVGATIGAATALGSPIAIAILGVVGATAGRFARDRSLARAARRRSRLIAAQVPATIELLALAVAAGEPVVTAVERVASATPAPLGAELLSAVADVRAGASVESALDGLSRRCGCRSVERFVDGLAVAIERGTPLAAILRAQASDARAEGLRLLMESAGRRDALMLVPVVFLVLPTVVAVALFPGIQTLRLVVP